MYGGVFVIVSGQAAGGGDRRWFVRLAATAVSSARHLRKAPWFDGHRHAPVSWAPYRLINRLDLKSFVVCLFKQKRCCLLFFLERAVHQYKTLLLQVALVLPRLPPSPPSSSHALLTSSFFACMFFLTRWLAATPPPPLSPLPCPCHKAS